jgi:hypothetical protein
MPPRRILLPILLLQFIPPLIYPAALLKAALPLISVEILVFIGLGIALWRGRSWALTLSIFIQGINVITRLMMLFPNSMSKTGELNLPFLITSLLAISLSVYFLLRLDRPDIRSFIIA